MQYLIDFIRWLTSLSLMSLVKVVLITLTGLSLYGYIQDERAIDSLKANYEVNIANCNARYDSAMIAKSIHDESLYREAKQEVESARRELDDLIKSMNNKKSRK